ncbi:MAG: DUF192 domain-containing protein [Dehalococcoidales bacterium]|nr:DUF192 domain-containing protein [Dehalococcoidales bacterium]
MPGQATVTIRDKHWDCAVASTLAELAGGLSELPDMPAGAGMLFVLGAEQIVTVTAENMLFPLSIIFIGNDLQVTEVAYLLAPGDYGTTSRPCRYFLEVNAGEAATVAAGDTVVIAFASIPPSPATDWVSPVVSLAGMMIAGGMLMNLGKTMTDRSGKIKDKPVRPESNSDKWLLQANPGRLIGKLKEMGINPTKPQLSDTKSDDLKLLPDSPEFLAYTIDDIGYRERLDGAFRQALARVKGGSRLDKE